MLFTANFRMCGAVCARKSRCDKRRPLEKDRAHAAASGDLFQDVVTLRAQGVPVAAVDHGENALAPDHGGGQHDSLLRNRHCTIPQPSGRSGHLISFVALAPGHPAGRTDVGPVNRMRGRPREGPGRW